MELSITGTIDDAEGIVAAIANASEDIDLMIDSPGGSAMAGLEIAHCIAKTQHKVTAHVQCLAASAAAIIALSCDSVEIDKNSLMMLHNCWTITMGNKEQLRNDADGMEAIDKVMHNIVDEHCTDDTLLARMNAGDLYLTGEEAASAFDHVTLVDIPHKEGLSAVASLVGIVTENRELKKALKEANASKNYEVPDKLKSLIEKAERV